MRTFSEWLQENDPEMAESFRDRIGRIKDRLVALPSILGNIATTAGGTLAGAAAGAPFGPAGMIIGGGAGAIAGGKLGRSFTSDKVAARAMKKK